MLSLAVVSMLVLIAVTAAYVAVRAADRADHQARKLQTLRGEVFGLSADLDKLASQHRRLEGKYYGTLGRLGPVQREAIETPPESSPPFAVCENWAIGQKTGPRSDAAACVCEYCCAMREQRHNVKAALVPKSHAARIQAIERGLKQPQ